MNGNMDLLTQAITQRPPQAPASPPAGASSYAPRKRERSGSPPSTTTTTADSRVNVRRNNILTQISNLDADFLRKKEKHFLDQLHQLQQDLSRLHDGTHTDFNLHVTNLADVRNETLYIAREEGLRRLAVAEAEYAEEVAAANEEYEKTKATLEDDLMAHLQEKRRRLESDRSTSDIQLATITMEQPPSPSLGSSLLLQQQQQQQQQQGGARKLRHRVPVVPTVIATYPPITLTSKSALDEVLENLAETIMARHSKLTQQPQNDDRMRDRIEREREKLVRSRLAGLQQGEVDADLAEIRRRLAGKRSAGGNASSTAPSGQKKVKA